MTPIEQFRPQENHDIEREGRRGRDEGRMQEKDEKQEQKPIKKEKDPDEKKLDKQDLDALPQDAEKTLRQPPPIISAEELAEALKRWQPTEQKQRERRNIAESAEIDPDDELLQIVESFFYGELAKTQPLCAKAQRLNDD